MYINIFLKNFKKRKITCFLQKMRTGIMHPIGVRKRLCVSVLGGKQSI
jgi:hypothetical protein